LGKDGKLPFVFICVNQRNQREIFFIPQMARITADLGWNLFALKAPAIIIYDQKKLLTDNFYSMHII
jgi:hypothetical protein